MKLDAYWVLDGHEPKPATLHEWALMIEHGHEQRRVANTTVGESNVSTVFLGMDHGWGDDDAPVLFETMIFDGPHDQWMRRYRTWDEAQAGHDACVAALREGREPDALGWDASGGV